VNQKAIIRVCAVVMALSGVVILVSSIYPILSYEWDAAQRYPILISPLVDQSRGDFKFSGSDSAKASTWVPGTTSSDFELPDVKYFNISIPRLKITNATVAVGSEDLAHYLIQFPGTALPGKIGNAVIFGHSILPMYFDPKNYMSIFSTLQNLGRGDYIYIDFDGINYTYKVENMFEVKPDDTQILEQTSAGSYLSLVTCSPPGHPLKPRRLIVRASLIPQGSTSLKD
jgi:sortase A